MGERTVGNHTQGNQQGETNKVLAIIERLPELADQANSLSAARELFQLANARLFLRFKSIQVEKRLLNKVAGGVVTLGDTVPPISIYEGPTGRSRLRESRVAGNDSAAPDRR